MKKLINEVMTVALIVSFSGNTFATTGRSNSAPLIAPILPPKAEVTEQPKPIFERVLNWMGYNTPATTVQAPPSKIEFTAPPVRTKKGTEYGATEIPDQKRRAEAKMRSLMNKKFRDAIVAGKKSEAQFLTELTETKKTLRPNIISLINRFYEDASMDTLSYKEKNEVTPIQKSQEHILMEQFLIVTLFNALPSSLQDGKVETVKLDAFAGHLDTAKKFVSKIFGLSEKAANAFVHDHMIDIYEKIEKLPAPSQFTQAAGFFNIDSKLVDFVRANTVELIGYDDKRIARNADGTIDFDAVVKFKDKNGKEVTINKNIYLMLAGSRTQNTTTRFVSSPLTSLKIMFSSFYGREEEARKARSHNLRVAEIANNLVRRNNVTSDQGELFSAAATDRTARSLGIVNADGSLNLADIELPAFRSIPKVEHATDTQIAALLQARRVRDTHVREGFYYPTNETHYILKMSAEELDRTEKEFPSLRFENAGVEGNILKLKVKNPRNSENIFVGYKIQPELLKKFAPLRIQDTVANQFKDAATHAATAFPMEAMTFYIGIYLNTLMELSINYKDDPAALEKFYHEISSVPGQLSFFAFMLGNRMFTNLVGPKVDNRILARLLPFLGMGVGSIASAGAHDLISLTNSCAIKLMKADEFDDEAKANAMTECDATYNQVVNSANTHNYITSFMNILVAGGMSAAFTGLLVKGAMLTTQGVVEGSKAAALATGNRGLVKTAMTLEGIAFELGLAKQEHQAYSLTKNLMNSGKMTTTGRLANWFGFVKNKPGNLVRVGSSLGRWGWKIAGGIVIFLAMDKRARPYTYYNEQLLLGSGSDLSMVRGRLNVQLDHLEKNNWTESICQTHVAQNKKNGFKSFYVDNPEDCSLIEKTQSMKKDSKLWRDSILYKFMANYSNWLMYVEGFQAQWSVAYTFYEELVNYAYMAKLAEYDSKNATRYNPLLHDDEFWGVLQTERASQEKNALKSLKTSIGDDFTFEGLNKLRAQKVIDILPVISKKYKEIKSKDFKKTDWKNVEPILARLITNISSYLLLSEHQKGNKWDRTKVIQSHFAKKTLTDADLPAYANYGALINTIDVINQNFDNYTSAYKSMKASGPSRDRTPQENQAMYTLYEKAIFFKELRSFLGKPKPSGRGEAFIRSFDVYMQSTYPEEQIKQLSKITGSAGKDMLWHALCGKDLITSADIENPEAKSAIVDAKWGKNVKFVYPRLTKTRNASICDSKDLSKLIPTRGQSANKNTALDYLIRNLTDSVLTSDGATLDAAWTSSVLPRLEEMYQKFDASYHALVEEQFIPKYLGKNGKSLLYMNPLEAHKAIKEQPRAKILGAIPAGNAGASIVQTYVDEMDSYLRIMSNSFDAALKQDVVIKFASNATAKQKEQYLGSSKKRKARFDALVNNFKASFNKIILSYGSGNVDVETEYAAMLLSYYTILKSVGVVGDITMEQKNVTEGQNTQTKFVVGVSRNPIGEVLLQQYILQNKTKEIEAFVKTQQTQYGVSDENSKKAFTEMYISSVIDQSFAGKMRLRLENQPDIRNSFIEAKQKVEANTSIDNPYGTDRNMSLPVFDAQTMQPKNVPGTLMYTQAGDMIENQFLGLLGASQSLDELMEEVYFNVNILKAASIENKYRDVERARLKKFKGSSMGGN